jgi:ribonuclease Z
MTIRVTLLGTGTPALRLDRFGPSTLIEAGESKFLFDAGRGVAQRLAQLQVPFSQVNRLFLTHLHSDHVVGLPDLWLTGWIFGRSTPLRIWGPDGTANMMEHLRLAFEADIHIRRDLDEQFPAEGIEAPVSEFHEGVVYDEDGVRITAFDVDHRPVEPAFGFRIEHGGRVVVLSGDTRYSENLVKHAGGADLLVHEVCAPDSMRRQSIRAAETTERVIHHHTTPEQAGELFTLIAPKLAVFSHIVGPPGCETEIVEGTRQNYAGAFEVGHDLMTIEVGDQVRIES